MKHKKVNYHDQTHSVQPVVEHSPNALTIMQTLEVNRIVGEVKDRLPQSYKIEFVSL